MLFSIILIKIIGCPHDQEYSYKNTFQPLIIISLNFKMLKKIICHHCDDVHMCHRHHHCDYAHMSSSSFPTWSYVIICMTRSAVTLHALLTFSLQCGNMHKYSSLEVLGNSGPRLLAGGPSGLLTSSLAPFGRLGRVTHVKGT